MNARSNRLLAACVAASLGGCAPAGSRDGPLMAPAPTAVHHAATQALRPFIGRLSVDDVPDGNMNAGQSAYWRFQFLDGPGQAPLRRFSDHHDKPMHLIVVSSDLSSFAHLHPALKPDGSFEIRVNAPTDDPDNADAATAVPRPGTYFLFGEVAPAGRSPTVTRFTVRAEGPERPVPLGSAPRSPDGGLLTYTAPAGRTGLPGDPYQVTLRNERVEHHPGLAMRHLVVTVRERDAAGRYREVDGLEPWLGMTGHAVLIGHAGARIEDRVFRHLHANGGAGGHGHGHHVMQAPGGRLTFMVMGQDEPPAGLYRLWCQFKHRGRILTAPFSVVL